MSNRVLALDLSLSRVGRATNAPAFESGTWEPPGKGVNRLQAVVGWLDGLLATRTSLVALEGYSFASRGRAVVSLAELGGCVRLHLFNLGIPVVEVPPACRAKLATGKGNASKAQVLVEAVRRLGYAGHSDDEADALWLLQAALHAYGLPGAVPLPQSHLGALVKIQWPSLSRTT